MRQNRRGSGATGVMRCKPMIKTLLRKAAERSFDALWAAIGRIIETIRPQECRNYFANSGCVSN